MTPTNPPRRLSAAPKGGCLPEEDGIEFSALMQAGRLAANVIGHCYPNLSDPNQLTAAYATTEGMIVLSHLSAAMYTYWDQAPAGPSAFALTREHLVPRVRETCRKECAEWGTHRLNAPQGKTLYVLEDTPAGSIVADHSMTKFYKVLGLKRPPVATLTRIGAVLPAAVRLTALPFRGVLVYDGIMGGTRPRTVSAADAKKLRKRYAEAKRRGTVITGFHVDTDNPRNSETPSIMPREISDLSEEEKKQVDDLKKMLKTNSMLVFRRAGYTEADNPSHTVVMMQGPLACGTFRSAKLVPSAEEVLRELVKLAGSSGSLPKMVGVDDKATANAVNEVTKHADICTGVYPPPSVEERVLMTDVPPEMLASVKGFGGAVAPNQCPVM